jgi:signal transduction histidine kinase
MKSVLDFSRTAEYKLEAVDLEHLIKRLLNRWRPHLARAEVKSHLQFQTGTPAVNGDQRALEQVFTNLISNAVQAMSEDGGTLAIKAYLSKSSRERPRVHITISDSGPGIPEEIKERIFEPFFTTNPEGTGLGLAITQRIIVAHKGSIHLTSFPGGTIFQIQLPVAD